MTEVSPNPTPNSSPIGLTALTPWTNNKNPTMTAQAPIRNPYTTNKTSKKAAGTFSYKKRAPMNPPDLTTELHSDTISLPTPTPTNNSTAAANTQTTKNRDDATQFTQLSSQSTFQTSNPHIPINDGTQRLTIRWKPNNFEQLNPDSTNDTGYVPYLLLRRDQRSHLGGKEDRVH